MKKPNKNLNIDCLSNTIHYVFYFYPQRAKDFVNNCSKLFYPVTAKIARVFSAKFEENRLSRFFIDISRTC